MNSIQANAERTFRSAFCFALTAIAFLRNFRRMLVPTPPRTRTNPRMGWLIDGRWVGAIIKPAARGESNLDRSTQERSERHPSSRGFAGRLAVLLAMLVGMPDAGLVESLQGQEGPAAAASVGVEQIEQWISQLSSPVFLEREHARYRLRQAGSAAYGQLYRGRKTDDLEARLTIQQLLGEIDIQWVGPSDSRAVVDLMLEFQSRDWPDRLAIIDRLSWMPVEECWQALYRITLFDPTEAVSRYAAAQLLQVAYLRDGHPGPGVQGNYEASSLNRYLEIGSLLNSDSRWGEKVIAVGFALGDHKHSILNLEKLLRRSFELQKLEKERLNGAEATVPADARQWLVESLLLVDRVLIHLADGYHRRNQTEASVRLLREADALALMPIEASWNTSNQLLVMETLFRHQRWDAARQLAQSLDSAEDPVLGYWELEIDRRSGEPLSASQLEQVSERIRDLVAQPAGLSAVVQRLLDWRLKYWAAHILRSRASAGELPSGKRLQLAELEVDLGHADAAEQLATGVFEQAESSGDRVRAALVLANVSRQREQAGEEAGWLRELLRLEPNSATALVRLGELADSLEDFDAEVFGQQIRIAEGAYRDQIRLGAQMAQSSKPAEASLGKTRMATAANSLAWLLANRGEDLELALKMAETAVQLEPFHSAYLDTLAFCEFQRGNRQRAIDWQRRAVFIDPESSAYRERLQRYLDKP